MEHLTNKDFTSDQEVKWCPSCGDYAILRAMQKTLPALERKRKTLFSYLELVVPLVFRTT